jgi:hypothetical protein
MREPHADGAVHAAAAQRDVERRRRHPHAGHADPGVPAAVTHLPEGDVGFDDEIRRIRESRREAAAAAGNLEDGARAAHLPDEAADQPALARRHAELERLAAELEVVSGRVFDVLELALVGGPLFRVLRRTPGLGSAVQGEERNAVLDRIAGVAAFAADPVRTDRERVAAVRAGEDPHDRGNAGSLLRHRRIIARKPRQKLRLVCTRNCTLSIERSPSSGKATST